MQLITNYFSLSLNTQTMGYTIVLLLMIFTQFNKDLAKSYVVVLLCKWVHFLAIAAKPIMKWTMIPATAEATKQKSDFCGWDGGKLLKILNFW